MASSAPVFLIPPATNPKPFGKDLAAALRAFKLFLDSAVADKPDFKAFKDAEEDFRQKTDKLGEQLGVANSAADSPQYLRDVWWLNIAVLGMFEAGINRKNVLTQLTSLTRRKPTLMSMLALQPEPQGDDPRRLDKVAELLQSAADRVLYTFYALVADIGLGNLPLVPDSRLYIVTGQPATLKKEIIVIARELPLPSVSARDASDAWRFNFYNLALGMLGYTPSR